MDKKIKTKASDQTLGIIYGIISAICVTGYLISNKYIYNNYHIGAVEYALIFAVSGGLFGLISLLSRMNRQVVRQIIADWHAFLVLSLLGGLAVAVLVIGQRYTTSVNTAFLTTTSIIATILFSKLILQESLSRRQIIWAAGLFAGLYLGVVGLHKLHFRSGDVIILGSSVIFGLGNIYSRLVMRRHGSALVPDMRLSIGGLLALAIGVFTIHNYALLGNMLPWLLLAGFFYWSCMKTFAVAVHLLNANNAIVLNQSQIFFTSLAGVIFFSEDYNLEKFIGSIIVIISIYFITGRKDTVSAKV